MKPMLMNVNGENIPLPNRFTFDLRPRCFKSDYSNDSSSSPTFGELKRVLDPRILSGKISSDWLNINCQLPDDIQALLDTIRELPTSDAPSRKTENCQHDASLSSNRPQDSKDSTGASERSETKPQDDEEERFRNMINRLQKRLPTPSLVKPRVPSTKLQPADPAILCAKLKDGAVFENAQLNQVAEPHPQKKGKFSDSGYASGSNPSCIVHYSTSDSSRDFQDEPAAATKRSLEAQSATKKLNPAAAEFRISTDSVHLPVLSPKKLSRGPLTSLLFNPIPDVAVTGALPSLERLQTAQTRQDTGTAVDMLQIQQPSPGKSGMKAKQKKAPQVPPIQQACLPPIQHFYNPALSDVNPMALAHPSLSLQPQKPNAALPFSPTPWTGGPGLGNFGTFPPLTAPSMPVSQFNMQSPDMAATLGTGTFLPSMRPPIPPFAPAPISGLGSMYPQAAVPAMPPVQPSIPLTGAGQQAQPGPKADRPYFPVTTKPRVPDPIKQQQYEEYLEWRKANEPGYHIKCKIRQANRVVRQHQYQAEAPKLEEPGISLAWKAIAEKAKAVVGAAEARRAAEKKSKQNSVVEEFKAKIIERVMGSSETKDDKEDSGKKMEDEQAVEKVTEKATEDKVVAEETTEETTDKTAEKTEEVKESVKA